MAGIKLQNEPESVRIIARGEIRFQAVKYVEDMSLLQFNVLVDLSHVQQLMSGAPRIAEQSSFVATFEQAYRWSCILMPQPTY
jgi:hypothetical protein